jgi:hypothetical protein
MDRLVSDVESERSYLVEQLLSPPRGCLADICHRRLETSLRKHKIVLTKKRFEESKSKYMAFVLDGSNGVGLATASTGLLNEDTRRVFVGNSPRSCSVDLEHSMVDCGMEESLIASEDDGVNDFIERIKCLRVTEEYLPSGKIKDKGLKPGCERVVSLSGRVTRAQTKKCMTDQFARFGERGLHSEYIEKNFPSPVSKSVTALLAWLEIHSSVNNVSNAEFDMLLASMPSEHVNSLEECLNSLSISSLDCKSVNNCETALKLRCYVRITVRLEDVEIIRPQIVESDGTCRNMWPYEAIQLVLSYCACVRARVCVYISFVNAGTPLKETCITPMAPKTTIAYFPVMVGTQNCHTVNPKTKKRHVDGVLNAHAFSSSDDGGYHIIHGKRITRDGRRRSHTFVPRVSSVNGSGVDTLVSSSWNMSTGEISPSDEMVWGSRVRAHVEKVATKSGLYENTSRDDDGDPTINTSGIGEECKSESWWSTQGYMSHSLHVNIHSESDSRFGSSQVWQMSSGQLVSNVGTNDSIKARGVLIDVARYLPTLHRLASALLPKKHRSLNAVCQKWKTSACRLGLEAIPGFCLPLEEGASCFSMDAVRAFLKTCVKTTPPPSKTSLPSEGTQCKLFQDWKNWAGGGYHALTQEELACLKNMTTRLCRFTYDSISLPRSHLLRYNIKKLNISTATSVAFDTSTNDDIHHNVNVAARTCSITDNQPSSCQIPIKVQAEMFIKDGVNNLKPPTSFLNEIEVGLQLRQTKRTASRSTIDIILGIPGESYGVSLSAPLLLVALGILPGKATFEDFTKLCCGADCTTDVTQYIHILKWSWKRVAAWVENGVTAALIGVGICLARVAGHVVRYRHGLLDNSIYCELGVEFLSRFTQDDAKEILRTPLNCSNETKKQKCGESSISTLRVHILSSIRTACRAHVGLASLSEPSDGTSWYIVTPSYHWQKKSWIVTTALHDMLSILAKSYRQGQQQVLTMTSSIDAESLSTMLMCLDLTNALTASSISQQRSCKQLVSGHMTGARFYGDMNIQGWNINSKDPIMWRKQMSHIADLARKNSSLSKGVSGTSQQSNSQSLIQYVNNDAPFSLVSEFVCRVRVCVNGANVASRQLGGNNMFLLSSQTKQGPKMGTVYQAGRGSRLSPRVPYAAYRKLRLFLRTQLVHASLSPKGKMSRSRLSEPVSYWCQRAWSDSMPPFDDAKYHASVNDGFATVPEPPPSLFSNRSSSNVELNGVPPKSELCDAETAETIVVLAMRAIAHLLHSEETSSQPCDIEGNKGFRKFCLERVLALRVLMPNVPLCYIIELFGNAESCLHGWFHKVDHDESGVHGDDGGAVLQTTPKMAIPAMSGVERSNNHFCNMTDFANSRNKLLQDIFSNSQVSSLSANFKWPRVNPPMVENPPTDANCRNEAGALKVSRELQQKRKLPSTASVTIDTGVTPYELTSMISGDDQSCANTHMEDTSLDMESTEALSDTKRFVGTVDDGWILMFEYYMWKGRKDIMLVPAGGRKVRDFGYYWMRRYSQTAFTTPVVNSFDLLLDPSTILDYDTLSSTNQHDNEPEEDQDGVFLNGPSCKHQNNVIVFLDGNIVGALTCDDSKDVETVSTFLKTVRSYCMRTDVDTAMNSIGIHYNQDAARVDIVTRSGRLVVPCMPLFPPVVHNQCSSNYGVHPRPFVGPLGTSLLGNNFTRSDAGVETKVPVLSELVRDGSVCFVGALDLGSSVVVTDLTVRKCQAVYEPRSRMPFLFIPASLALSRSAARSVGNHIPFFRHIVMTKCSSQSRPPLPSGWFPRVGLQSMVAHNSVLTTEHGRLHPTLGSVPVHACIGGDITNAEDLLRVSGSLSHQACFSLRTHVSSTLVHLSSSRAQEAINVSRVEQQANNPLGLVTGTLGGINLNSDAQPVQNNNSGEDLFEMEYLVSRTETVGVPKGVYALLDPATQKSVRKCLNLNPLTNISPTGLYVSKGTVIACLRTYREGDRRNFREEFEVIDVGNRTFDSLDVQSRERACEYINKNKHVVQHPSVASMPPIKSSSLMDLQNTSIQSARPSNKTLEQCGLESFNAVNKHLDYKLKECEQLGVQMDLRVEHSPPGATRSSNVVQNKFKKSVPAGSVVGVSVSRTGIPMKLEESRCMQNLLCEVLEKVERRAPNNLIASIRKEHDKMRFQQRGREQLARIFTDEDQVGIVWMQSIQPGLGDVDCMDIVPRFEWNVATELQQTLFEVTRDEYYKMWAAHLKFMFAHRTRLIYAPCDGHVVSTIKPACHIGVSSGQVSLDLHIDSVLLANDGTKYQLMHAGSKLVSRCDAPGSFPYPLGGRFEGRITTMINPGSTVSKRLVSGVGLDMTDARVSLNNAGHSLWTSGSSLDTRRNFEQLGTSTDTTSHEKLSDSTGLSCRLLDLLGLASATGSKPALAVGGRLEASRMHAAYIVNTSGDEEEHIRTQPSSLSMFMNDGITNECPGSPQWTPQA